MPHNMISKKSAHPNEAKNCNLDPITFIEWGIRSTNMHLESILMRKNTFLFCLGFRKLTTLALNAARFTLIKLNYITFIEIKQQYIMNDNTHTKNIRTYINCLIRLRINFIIHVQKY